MNELCREVGRGDAGEIPAPMVGRFLQVSGRRVHLLVQGSGPPVLLLHGNGSVGEEVLAPFAAHRGVTWLAPDRPGYGFSEAAKGRPDPAEQAEWAVALIDALRLPAVHIMAHSIAAGLAMCVAGRFPDRSGHGRPGGTAPR
jgi:pimeloyl-ACP methyl ester carboxylesterase